MLSKQKIDELIKIGESGDNFVNDASLTDFKRKLVNGKCMIDRWNLMTDKIYINPSYQELFTEMQCDNPIDSKTKLWGVDVFFTHFVPIGKILMLSSQWNKATEDKERHISVVKINAIEKYEIPKLIPSEIKIQKDTDELIQKMFKELDKK